MAEEYLAGGFQTMEMEEYCETVADQLELLPPETVIQRVTGDGLKEELIAPLWSLKKFVVMNTIDKELYRRDSWQGKNGKVKIRLFNLHSIFLYILVIIFFWHMVK